MFLVDAQLPSLLKDVIESKGFTCLHTFDLPNGNFSADTELIDFALTNNLIIISKDFDFLHSHKLFGRPNKLVLVNTGNIKNKALLDLFRGSLELIINSLSSSDVVILTKDELTVL